MHSGQIINYMLKPISTLKVLLLFILVTTTSTIFAQAPKVFSEEPTEFIKELKLFFESSNNKKYIKAFDDFETLFLSGVFDENAQNQMIKNANRMRSQRMSVNPYFMLWTGTIQSIMGKENGAELFPQWQQVYTDMLAADYKIRDYKLFLDFSQNFYTSKAIRQGPRGGTSWFAISDDFELQFKEEPIISFPSTELLATRGQDSLYILETSGQFLPLSNHWNGKGGKATWERLGLGTDIYALLGDYTVAMTTSLYKVENAELHYPLYFGERLIKGNFSDKLVPTKGTVEGSYPRFESEEKKLEIKNLGEGIGYKGGFALQGTTIYGKGDKDNMAELTLANERNKRLFHGYGEQFVFRKEDRVNGRDVEATVFLGKDSLYHPSIDIRYDLNKKTLQLNKAQSGQNHTPFYDSFHDFYLTADNVELYMEADSVVIGKPVVNVVQKNPVVLESPFYFDKNEYEGIQSINTSNPLAIMRATANKEGTNFIDSDLLASRINSKFSTANIERLLYELVRRGFVNYYPEEGIVEVRPKVFHYVEANDGAADFDRLKLISDTKGNNASMRVTDLDLLVEGVDKVEFSQAQKVGVKPYGGQIVLKKDRNFDFHGRLFAGYGLFSGQDFHFDYNKFQVQSDSIHTIDFFIPTGAYDKDKNEIAEGINSKIEKVSGVILIDAPGNKSGKEDIFMFPSFQSKGNSYVFYEKDSIFNRAYPQDSFYFEIQPFSFNHLDTIVEEDLQFKGKLVSMDIFPDIKQTLELRGDRSLGFVHSTKGEGLPIYQGKGQYKGDIDLSNNGLLGEGNLKYLGASLDSEDFQFKPKQLTGSAQQFALNENRAAGAETPKTYGEEITIDWKPYLDSMYVKTKEKPFELFNEKYHTLEGTAILTPGGLKGDGVFDWDKASMKSGLISFGAFSATADTTSLNIKSLDDEDASLSTANVKADVDFDNQIGIFESNDKSISTTLPVNQYTTSLSKFEWDMDQETINFISDKDKMGIFTSIHLDQDSLMFEGESALFDIKNKELHINGVPVIRSADALIYPDSNYVLVKRGAKMDSLINAKIVADTSNRHHVINRAVVQIKGKKEYTARGFYEYNITGKDQEIEFQNIVGTRVGKGKRSEKATETRAEGIVKEEDEFYIDKKTKFQGTIRLSAKKKELDFDGFAMLDADKLPYKTWFTVKSEGDRKDLTIRYKKPKAMDGTPLFTGLYLSKETARIYPRVMMPLNFRKDRALLPAVGVFKYDESKDAFLFGDSTKIVHGLETGNLITYYNRDGRVKAEGKFNIGSGLKYISVTAAGFADSKFAPPPPEQEEEDTNMIILDDDDADAPPPEPLEYPTTAELMTGIELIIPDQLMKVMVNDFKASTFDSRIITYLTDLDFYRKTAKEIFPDNNDMAKAISGMTSGYFDIPSKYNPYTFFFSRLKLKWDPDYQSFVTTNTQNGLATINGETINKKVESYIEFKMPSNNDDRLYIYIKSPSELYYFFGYKQGILNVVSNNPDFMKVLNGLKSKDLVTKMKDGFTYEIQAVEPGTANRFLRRIKAVQK